MPNIKYLPYTSKSKQNTRRKKLTTLEYLFLQEIAYDDDTM